MSSWENTNLDQNQCMYAATDAFVSVKVNLTISTLLIAL